MGLQRVAIHGAVVRCDNYHIHLHDKWRLVAVRQSLKNGLDARNWRVHRINDPNKVDTDHRAIFTLQKYMDFMLEAIASRTVSWAVDHSLQLVSQSKRKKHKQYG